jgi:curved DNA-binding protein CbpA
LFALKSVLLKPDANARTHLPMYQSRTAAQPRGRKNGLYAKLGISPNASQREIETAYRVLEQAYRPGGAYTDDVMHQAFLEISNAAAILADPRRRRLYDLNYIDETGNITQAGLARAARVRDAVIVAGISIAVIASLFIFNFGGPVPEANHRTVQTVPPPQKVVAAEPSPSKAAASPQLEINSEANKPASQSPDAGATVEASTQDYLPPAPLLKRQSAAEGASGQPNQGSVRPRRRSQYSNSLGPEKLTRRLAQSAERDGETGSRAAPAPGGDNEFTGASHRGRIAASDSPASRTAQCLACLTNDRANCSKTCP